MYTWCRAIVFCRAVMLTRPLCSSTWSFTSHPHSFHHPTLSLEVPRESYGKVLRPEWSGQYPINLSFSYLLLFFIFKLIKRPVLGKYLILKYCMLVFRNIIYWNKIFVTKWSIFTLWAFKDFFHSRRIHGSLNKSMLGCIIIYIYITHICLHRICI